MTTIVNPQAVAIDQPQIYGVLQVPGQGMPSSDNNIKAFLDTGTSSVLVSKASFETLGYQNRLERDAFNQPVVFSDVGVGGLVDFNVSQPFTLHVGPFPDGAPPYNQTYNNLRLQVGPLDANPDPFLETLDVFGMPTMMGKVTVLDPRMANEFLDVTHTAIYNPGNPAIPRTSHHVRLSYGDFSRFTEVTPGGSPTPNMAHNPIIGPDPVRRLDPNPPIDTTPPVSLSFGGLRTTGSFLFDTGSVTSFISQDVAARMHVRYVPGTYGTEEPELERFDPNHPEAPGVPIADQFTLPIGGIGDSVTSAGFFLDDLVLQTIEGSSDLFDANNFRFVRAPVLVQDISVHDPHTGQDLTLDGDLGMNYLVSSIEFDPIEIFGDFAEGQFNWIVFDEPNGLLGLDLIGAPPPTAHVVNRQLFYNDSKWDVTNATLPGYPSDNALALDKLAYMPGSGASTFANVSSYNRGINGLVIDLLGPHGSSLTASDFIFRTGSNNSPNSWSSAPAPTSISIRPGAGAFGSDRVELTWANGAIKKTWLEVVVKSNANTGLSQKAGYPAGYGDVFFFGSAVGETGIGNSTTFSVTDGQDEIAVRGHVGFAFLKENPYDFNRDRIVDANDQLIARGNLGLLRFITVGAEALAPTGDAEPPIVAPLATTSASTDDAARYAAIRSALVLSSTSRVDAFAGSEHRVELEWAPRSIPSAIRDALLASGTSWLVVQQDGELARLRPTIDSETDELSGVLASLSDDLLAAKSS